MECRNPLVSHQLRVVTEMVDGGTKADCRQNQSSRCGWDCTGGLVIGSPSPLCPPADPIMLAMSTCDVGTFGTLVWRLDPVPSALEGVGRDRDSTPGLARKQSGK